MNTQIWRLLIAMLNLGLIVVIVVLGHRTFLSRVPVPPGERVPSGFDATRYQIKETAIVVRPITSFKPVWTELRKPIPVAPKPTAVSQRPVRPAPPPATTPERVIEQRFLLVGTSTNPQDPGRSTCYVRKKSGGSVIVLKIGETFPETKCMLIALAEANEGVKATVRDETGKTAQIVLKKE